MLRTLKISLYLRFLVLFMIIGLYGNIASGQETDPETILRMYLDSQAGILDYEADVEIDVDVDFIRMPVKEVTVYYKAPDKIKFKSDEFFMLPRRGLDQSIRQVLMGEHTSVLVGQEYIGTRYHHIIKVIPLSRKSDLVLATLWVDSTTFLITKMENYSRSRGNFNVFLEYYEDIQLPSKISIEFEVKEINFPMDFINRTIEIDREKMKSDTLKTGYVYLRFSDYKINYGVNEAVFIDEAEE